MPKLFIYSWATYRFRVRGPFKPVGKVNFENCFYPLLLVPFDTGFYQKIELKLYVNGRPRQRALAAQMIWTPDEVLSQTLADCESPYLLDEETINIAEFHGIAAGILVLTGTPAGVMFHLANLWNSWAYLREGDIVTSFGTYLGFTRNTNRLADAQ